MSGRVYSGVIRLLVVSAGALGFALVAGRSARPCVSTRKPPRHPWPRPGRAVRRRLDGDGFSQMGPATFALSVKPDAGKLAATVGSDGQATVSVHDISVAGKSLVLKYHTDYAGDAGSDGDDAHPRRAGSQGGPGDDGRPVRDVRDGGETCAPARPRPPGTRRRLRRRPRSGDERGHRLLAEAPLSPAHAGGGSQQLHASDRLSDGARRRRPGRDQPERHRVRRQRPHVCRRDDQLHDGRQCDAASTTRSAAFRGGRARRTTAITTSTPSSSITSSPRA